MLILNVLSIYLYRNCYDRFYGKMLWREWLIGPDPSKPHCPKRKMCQKEMRPTHSTGLSDEKKDIFSPFGICKIFMTDFLERCCEERLIGVDICKLLSKNTPTHTVWFFLTTQKLFLANLPFVRFS